MSKAKIIAYLTIITLILGIPVAIYQLKSPFTSAIGWLSPKDDILIELKLEPAFISEGQYKEIPIEILIPNVQQNNITSVTLHEYNIKVDRLNKNKQTQVATQISWDETFSGYDWVFNYRGGMQYPSRTELRAKGKLICPENNCFMGEDSPYQITFTLHYSIGNGAEIPITITKDIPVN